MDFCSNCDNMYYIKLENEECDKIVYYCRSCGNVDDQLINVSKCILKENINPCSLAYILTLKGAKNMVSFFEKTGFLRATDGNFNDYLQTKKIFYGSTTVLVTGNSDLKSDIFIH